MNSTTITAEADAAFQSGHWARAAAMYEEALKSLPQTTKAQRIEWARVCRLQQSATDSANFVRCVARA